MVIPAITLERWFASRYINNYEKTGRSWVSTLANGTSIVLTVTFCMLFQLGLYFMLLMTLLAAAIFLLSFLAVVGTYRRDLAKLQDLSNEAGTSIITYTLSMKFQLAENVRVTKMLTVASIGMTPWGFGGCGIFVVSYIIFGEETSKGQLLYAVWNLYIASSLTIAVWLSLAAVKNISKPPRFCCLTRKVINIAVCATASYEVDTATDKYFSQLVSVWDSR
ncbi:unnamed protein product [Cylicocyclus nassatus]|uniref:Uncharacterized protein n=1 Tax=Cylicocyclus nassatus TaxID=53992 RepID=A0AA36HE09_CYLNA|nr:unnamed protein product [Cylicocyclus nassatus]